MDGLLLSIFQRPKLGFFTGYPVDVITVLGLEKGSSFKPLGCAFEKGVL